MAEITFKIDTLQEVDEAIAVLKAIKKVKQPIEPPQTQDDGTGGGNTGGGGTGGDGPGSSGGGGNNG